MNRRILLRAHPEGMIRDSDFSMESAKIPDPQEGQVLVKVGYLSLDPAMRGWMNPGTTYIKGVAIGEVMRAFGLGKVVASRHPDLKEGTWVTGLLGAQTHAVADGKSLQKADETKGPLSWHLGVLGMPGMTAYFGLLDRGTPRAGETVFISGAAGIIGSTVGQIAKIKGCKVVGTAGSDEKCRYLMEESGFDAAINYKTTAVEETLKKTCPEGVHVFFDNVGGPLMDTVLAHLARGARVVICGAISQYNNTRFYGPKNYMKIVSARGELKGIIVFDYAPRYSEAIDQLSAWLHSGQMKTKEHIIDGIENFAHALKKLFTGENFGKLLIKV